MTSFGRIEKVAWTMLGERKGRIGRSEESKRAPSGRVDVVQEQYGDQTRFRRPVEARESCDLSTPAGASLLVGNSRAKGGLRDEGS